MLDIKKGEVNIVFGTSYSGKTSVVLDTVNKLKGDILYITNSDEEMSLCERFRSKCENFSIPHQFGSFYTINNYNRNLNITIMNHDDFYVIKSQLSKKDYDYVILDNINNTNFDVNNKNLVDGIKEKLRILSYYFHNTETTFIGILNCLNLVTDNGKDYDEYYEAMEDVDNVFKISKYKDVISIYDDLTGEYTETVMDVKLNLTECV